MMIRDVQAVRIIIRIRPGKTVQVYHIHAECATIVRRAAVILWGK